MHTIFIVEDDPKISSLLKSYIEKYGYRVVVVTDFDRILESFQEAEADLVLLDVNLPRFDGFYWCRQIRAISNCPILFISAREEKMDQLMALQNGADDYITKPFYPEIVVAKIENHFRRMGLAEKRDRRALKLAGLVYYPDTLKLKLKEQEIDLSHKEGALLEIFLENPDQIVGREHLMDAVWDSHQFVDGNTLNVWINRLRKKLQEIGAENALETIRGAGYRIIVTWESGQEQ
ncbi:response regulator transcription factor [Croceifilum oryzae]|uniref:response regulator transcription factor n=1 Tax=Croceifilum oryzae TaxID=1553429 RepID=UPI0027D7D6E3|nr:response regulator transcription factor [Croceifilum oryzae]